MKECEDCHGIVEFFDEPCPTCGGSGYIDEKRRPSTKGKLLKPWEEALLQKKLESVDGQELIRWYRAQAGLPEVGLTADEASLMLVESVTRVFQAYLFLNHRKDVQQQLSSAWSALVPGTLNAEAARPLDLLASPSQPTLAVLRIGAAYICSWLGVEDDGWIMAHLISSDGKSIADWKPVKSSSVGSPLTQALNDIAQGLFPFPDSRHPMNIQSKGYMGDILVKFVTSLRKLTEGSPLRWEEILLRWNKVFPIWSVDDSLALAKTYRYWLGKAARAAP